MPIRIQFRPRRHFSPSHDLDQVIRFRPDPPHPHHLQQKYSGDSARIEVVDDGLSKRIYREAKEEQE